jgi:hypothetical protein
MSPNERPLPKENQMSETPDIIEELKPIALSFFDMIDEIFEIGTHRK